MSHGARTALTAGQLGTDEAASIRGGMDFSARQDTARLASCVPNEPGYPAQGRWVWRLGKLFYGVLCGLLDVTVRSGSVRNSRTTG